MKNCQSKDCKTEATEASGYCFSCAEEFAYLLAGAEFSQAEISRLAWGREGGAA